jgi:hypothetical protein
MDVERIAAFGRASGVYDFMNTAYGWPAIESLHFVGLAVLLGTVGLFDLRALGVAKGVPMTALHRLVPLGVAAFLANIVTGAMFFVSAPDQYMFNPAFRLKLACMALAGLNVAVFYGAFARGVPAEPAARATVPVRIVAAVSLLAWIGVIVFGRLITYFRPPYHWQVFG